MRITHKIGCVPIVYCLNNHSINMVIPLFLLLYFHFVFFIFQNYQIYVGEILEDELGVLQLSM